MADETAQCPNCGEPACSECGCSQEDIEQARLGQCSGADVYNRRTNETRRQRCAWTEKSDWMGDPSIPNGTTSWRFAHCLVCGSDVQQPYPEWLQRRIKALRDERF